MILYILKSTACMAIFLGLYYILLEKEKMHHFKRFYLLISLITSLSIPVWVIHTEYLNEAVVPDSTSSSLSGFQAAIAFSNATPDHLTGESVFWGIYVMGLVFFSTRFGLNIWQMFILIRRNPKFKLPNAQLILHEKPILASSFLNYIFLRKKAYDKPEMRALLIAHENAHVVQKHSLDILLVELIHCLYWFNPLIVLYKKAIRLNHEYLADEAVIRQIQNPKVYMHLLIDQAGKNSISRFATFFNYGQTQKRLIMMNVQSSLTHFRIRLLAVIAVFIVVILSFGRTQTLTNSAIVSKSHLETVTDSSQIQYDLNRPDGGMIAYEVVEAGDPHKGMTMIFEEHGKKIHWQVYASISGHSKVSFVNEEGIRIEKFAKELNSKEREWFWQLEQSQAQIYRMPIGMEMPKPTETQLKDFLDPSVYGVWVDGVRIQNDQLQNYQVTDFHSVFVSSLARNAKHYGQYSFHVNLGTQKAFSQKYEGRENGWWEKVSL